MSPTIKRADLSGTALMSDCISMTSTIEASSTTSRGAVERIVFAALEAAPLGVNLQQPVDRPGLKTGRLGHALGGRGRSARIAGALPPLLRECGEYL